MERDPDAQDVLGDGIRSRLPEASKRDRLLREIGLARLPQLVRS